jgi:hypothetical protein
VLLGSPFGAHSLTRKSQSHPHDIRQKWGELATNPQKRVYPKPDLVDTHLTLKQILVKEFHYASATATA